MSQYLDNIYVLTGQGVRKKHPAAFQRTLRGVFDLIADATYAHLAKLDRWFFSQSSKDIRPTLETSYQTWNGVVVIDLDIKNNVAANELKARLHRLLGKQPWYAGVALSTSKNGLHIYTACKPDIALTTQEVYNDHVEAMSIYVWQALLIAYNIATAENKLSKKDLLDMHPEYNMSSRKELAAGQLSESRMFDTATFKLTQPTLLGYDPDLLINDNFLPLPPLAFNVEQYDKVQSCDMLKQMFDKKRGRTVVDTSAQYSATSVNLPKLEQCMPRPYDNTARYRLAYTIANLFDITSSAHPNYRLLQQCFLRMCSGNPKFNKERQAFEAVFDSAVQRQASGLCPQIPWAVHELKTVHSFDIEVENEQVVQEQIVNVDIDLELAKPVLIPPELQLRYDDIFALEPGQYVAHGTHVLLEKLSKPNDKVLLIAEPGLGKTVFATNLMQNTNLRVLCVVPYISVIESKFKTLPPDAKCQCVYGFNGYDVSASPNAVMTFDKFSKMALTDLDMCFDIIILDESHLLQMSAYRSLVPANAVDNLRDTKTPVVLMTGTPIAEHMFVPFTYKVMFKHKRATSKLFSVVVCNNPAEKYAHACLHISNAIKAGRRVIMPTNEGNSYVEKVVASVQELLCRPVHWQYYKKEFAEEAFMFDVNRKSTLGDIELLFCSAYLSVGVDINDIDKFDIVYTEDFTANEIEQFNNRLRRVDLASYYFIAKYNNDGGAKPNCFASITPNLRVSKIRQLELRDLIALQTVQVDESGQVSKLFDYFAKHMRMPWLLKQPDGTVNLHATCYALWTFEDTWRKWACQVPILVHQLRDYNYQIEVINTELMENDAMSDILESGRNGLHDYKDRITDDLLFIVEQMQNKDFYDIMVYSNAIRLVQRRFQGLEQVDDHFNLYVQNVAQCHRFMRSVRMLAKYYTRSTVLSLYDQVDGKLSKFEQVCQTVELLDYASNDRLSIANVDAVRYVLYDMFGGQQTTQMSKKQYMFHLHKIADMYRSLYDLQASTIIDKVTAHADSMIKRLAYKTTNMRGELAMNIWELKTIPAFDSSAQLNLEAQKQALLSMFKASMFATNTAKPTSKDVQGFFVQPSLERESDQVDLTSSISNLKSVTIVPKLADSDKRKMQRYIQQNYPDVQLHDIVNLIASIEPTELTSDLQRYRFIDARLNELGYKLQL